MEEAKHRLRPSSGSASGYIPALDGLRALAVVAVLFYHYGHLSGGFLGVDLFFVLSGYLITRVLLVKRAGAGSFGLGWFWLRRARRLFPAVLVLLAVVEIWVHYIGSDSLSRLSAGQSRASLVYGTNWYNIFVHLKYADIGLNQTPINHLWTLAVEEQFYVIWPLLAFLFLNRWFLPRVFGFLALSLAAISYGIAPIVFRDDGLNAAYLGTEVRIGAILLGCTVALLSWNRVDGRVSRLRGARRAGVEIGGLGCAAILGYFWCTGHLDGSLFHGVLAVCGVSAALLILFVMANPSGWLNRVLSLKPFTYVGKRSYSLYLWHYPILILVSEQRTALHGDRLLVTRVVLTVLATELSYRVVENPIHRSRVPARRLVPALVAAAVAVGLLTTLAPVQSSTKSNLALSNGPVPAAAANLRIMVAGDSWAEHTAAGLTTMAPPRPAQVFSVAEDGCGIADPTSEIDYKTGDAFAPTAQCLDWPSRWRQTLTDDRPDAVLLALGNWDQARQEFDHSGSFVTACDPAFQTRYAHQLDSALALLTSTKAAVFMTNVIDNQGPLLPISNCMNDLLSAAAARNAARGVHLLDLRHLLCPSGTCPDFLDGVRVYDDTGHLTVGTQVGVCSWELKTILQTTQPRIAAAASQSSLQTALGIAYQQALPAFPAATQARPANSPAEGQFSELAAVPSLIAQASDHGTIVVTHGATTVATALGYQFPTDSGADAVAVAVQAALLAKHDPLIVDTANLKFFGVTNASGSSEVLGALRTLNHVVYIVVAGAFDAATIATARTYLNALAPHLQSD